MIIVIYTIFLIYLEIWIIYKYNCLQLYETSVKAEYVLSLLCHCFKNACFQVESWQTISWKEDILRWLHLSEYHPAAQIGSSCLERDVIKHCELNVKFNKKFSVS